MGKKRGRGIGGGEEKVEEGKEGFRHCGKGRAIPRETGNVLLYVQYHRPGWGCARL